MGRIKPRGRYMAISVPIQLHTEITEFVKKSNYNSIAEFVKEAVRQKIESDRYELGREAEEFYQKKLTEKEKNELGLLLKETFRKVVVKANRRIHKEEKKKKNNNVRI